MADLRMEEETTIVKKQTDWWFALPMNGKPIQTPLLIAAIPSMAILALPVAAMSTLTLVAAIPFLGLLTLFVLATIPWWLHLPFTSKPLVIPLFLLFIPVAAFLGICLLCCIPAILVCVWPLFCLLPVIMLF